MFDAVRFQSYKCLADVTIELGRMTLLVGVNGSGKSSVLEGLELLCGVGRPDERNPGRLRTHRRSEALQVEASTGHGPDRKPVRRTELVTHLIPMAHVVASRRNEKGEMVRSELKPGEPVPIAELDVEQVRGLVERKVRAGHGPQPCVLLAIPGSREAAAAIEEAASSTSPHTVPESEGAVGRFVTSPADEPSWDEAVVGPVVRLRLDAARVAGFAVDTQRPQVASDGGGTAAVIAWLAEQRAPELEDIEADLRRVVPRARRFFPVRAQQQNALGRVFSLEMDGGAQVPADLLSEGTLLTIGLLTVLHGRPAPRLILLDDFDRALHPTAQRQLVACVKDILARRTDLQFVCTTHSPFVLNLFEADDVRVLRVDADGLTHARRLTEHPEWAAWKGTLKPGEFWSYVGEEWLDAPPDGR